MRLRGADVQFFRRHGWLILRGAVGRRRLAALTRAFDRLLPSEGRRYRRVGGDARGEQVIHVRGHDATLQAWAVDRPIGRLVAALLGCRRVQLLQDVLLLKPARRGRHIKWHQDYGYIAAPLAEPCAVSVRLALTPEDATTGCLQVLDGSHRHGLIEEPSAISEATRSIELSPGDLSIHHCLTLHWSGTNRGPAPRKTIILFAFDAERGLDPSRPTSLATDSDGRLDGVSFPVMFERRASTVRSRDPSTPRRGRCP